MKIGEKTLKKGGELLTNSLLTYQESINKAYLKAGGEELKITLGLAIKAGNGDGNFKLQSKIKFVTDQIEDTFSESVDERQTNLFEDVNQPTRLCPERKDGAEIFESVCAKCKDRMLYINTNADGIKHYNWLEDLPFMKQDDLRTAMSCSAWADDDYKEWCDEMVRRAKIMLAERAANEVATPRNWYRIRNKKTNDWWEYTAVSAISACDKAGWNPEDCEIKIKSDNGGGGWKKCRELDMKDAA